MEIILSIVGTVILIGGLVVGIRQLVLLGKQIRVMANQMQSQLEWNIKDATFDYITKFRSELEATNIALQKKFELLKLDGTPLSHSHIAEIISDDRTRVHVFNLVSYCDQLALGISQKYFDETIAFESLCVSITSAYKSLIPYIKLRRDETGINVAEYFETLSQRWIEKIQEDPSMIPAGLSEDTDE